MTPELLNCLLQAKAIEAEIEAMRANDRYQLAVGGTGLYTEDAYLLKAHELRLLAQHALNCT